MIIDTHVHILDEGHWPNAWWNYVAEDWAGRDADRRPEMVRDRIESGLIDPDANRMIQHMDHAGIDIVCDLPIDWGPDYPSPQTPEEMVAHAVACANAHPGRILAFGGIDPRRDKAPDQLEKWIVEDGVRGLKLYPPCGWWPEDERAMALYEVCVRHDIPVLFHTGDPLPLLDGEYARPMHLLPVVEAFPELKVWMGHSGAHGGWDEALAVAEASTAAMLELSVWIWDNSATDDELRLAKLVGEAKDRVGAERILFGTDHVSGRKERREGFLTHITDVFRRLPEIGAKAGVTITPADVELIMAGNAARDLGIKGA